MSGIIKALSPDAGRRRTLPGARAGLEKAGADHARVVAGAQRYGKLCVSRHRASAAGAHTIPRLAGQQVQYLEDSLKRYRDRGGERVDPCMAAYTRNLKNGVSVGLVSVRRRAILRRARFTS